MVVSLLYKSICENFISALTTDQSETDTQRERLHSLTSQKDSHCGQELIDWLEDKAQDYNFNTKGEVAFQKLIEWLGDRIKSC